jgi:hypothetical protein
MPAFLLFIWFFTGYVPRWLIAHGMRGNIFKAFMMIFIGVIIVHHMLISDKIYGVKKYSVGEGHDKFYAFVPQINSQGLAVSHFLEWARELHADATFVVLPEGVMLNYLSRKANPTKYINFMVPEMRVFGQGNILSDFMDKKPDFIVLVHKDTSEYGEDFFGRDYRYGKSIMDWINLNYHKHMLIGEEPLKDNHFGIQIMKKNS